MIEQGNTTSKGEWTTPYAQAGGAHSLSGPALAEVAKDVLARGHQFRFLTLGGSMSPFIRDGDVVTLTPFDGSTIALGEIVAFTPPKSGRLVVHRVVSIVANRCRIKGDNNFDEDGVFSIEFIIGKVSRVERMGNEVRYGLGPERALIALLSRHGWLYIIMSMVRAVYSVVRRSS